MLTVTDLCSPCQRRGRMNPATRVIGWPPEAFCDSCFNGEGTILEMRGDSVGDPQHRLRNIEYQKRPEVLKRKALLAREYRKRRRLGR